VAVLWCGDCGIGRPVVTAMFVVAAGLLNERLVIREHALLLLSLLAFSDYLALLYNTHRDFVVVEA
jgi:hypothetical protein